MKKIILIKNGEIALKGFNRGSFEKLLMKNIKNNISHLGDVYIHIAQSTIYIEPKDENYDIDSAVLAIKKVFGIAAFSVAAETQKDMDSIRKTAVEYLKDELAHPVTFKVESKRSDKKFPLKSPEISAEIGGSLLEAYPHLTVDVRKPQKTVTVEVRDKNAFVHSEVIRGAGGMPVGSSGRAVVLLSGGIDSPVAAHMMAKRGMQISAVHFLTPPYTGMAALLKVEDLAKCIAQYAGPVPFIKANLTEICEEIRDKCREDYMTIIMRRFMMMIAQRVAAKQDADALITGESVGQVASQTPLSLKATDAAVTIPVFRPLIGMDKVEIIERAHAIGSYETSIIPAEDCCTVFTPRRPATKPFLDKVLFEEAKLDVEGLIEKCIANLEFKTIRGEKDFI